MSRKRNRLNTHEVVVKKHHEHHQHHEHQLHHRYDDEVSSTGEELESTGELENDPARVPDHISTTGRLLPDYPVSHAHETPQEREERRLDTIDVQLDNIDTSVERHEEDVQIDRYRAQHLPSYAVGKPHTQLDDELEHKPSDAYNEVTAAGDPIVRKNAHTVVGMKQAAQARHLAIKRQLGLSEDEPSLSPASPHKKQ